jgi:DNA-binding XRE family transcriptional regulator
VRKIRRTELEIEGKPYVLMAQADFHRLCERADGPREDATKFGRGHVGPDLRARRIRARQTLTQVARRAGIRLETLSRIENGHTDPSVRTVQAILRALEGTP